MRFFIVNPFRSGRFLQSAQPNPLEINFIDPRQTKHPLGEARKMLLGLMREDCAAAIMFGVHRSSYDRALSF